MKHHVAGLAWQAEDEMSAAMEAIFVSEFDGFFRCGEIVAAVDSLQGAVVNRLDAELENDWTNRANRTYRADRTDTTNAFQHFQYFFVDTVGTGADDESDDAIDGESFAIKFFQFIDRLICVAKCLKISEI